MDAKQLAEIKAREQAATKGPWMGIGYHVLTECRNYEDEICETECICDADFIIHARTDIPALVAEVERLTEENSNLKEIMSPVKLAQIAMMQIDFKRLQAEKATLERALGMMRTVAIRSKNIHPSWFTTDYFIQQAQEQEGHHA
ncbi:MAG: hypothetical protein E7L17_14485 [Clostridium sp.]|uniref:hypothetical protein n=1 Tax=Clostridium sp. TaxID=1506 RepID=UPI0029060469|nr:hypothetical protein [Clostridium sp.]MDU7339307.1 hypothetical protein [Clostridium sp.]